MAKKAKPRRPKPRCKNCGDETTFSTSVGEREHLGWCVGCYKQGQTFRKQADGSGYWSDEHKSINSGGVPKAFRPRSNQKEED